MKTRHLQLVTHTHSVTVRTKSSVSSPYGPVRAGLTTSQRTSEDQVLMELLSSLERKIADLNTRSYTVYDTLTIAIHEVERVLRYTSTIEKVGTNV